MPSVVLFDLDGTLVDTMPAFTALAASVLHRHFGTSLAAAAPAYVRTSGVPFAEQLRELHGDDPRNPSASRDFERQKDPIARAARMSPDARRALRRLREMNVQLVVSSNGAQRHVEHFVDAHPGTFALGLGACRAGGKGEPHVRRVCELFAVPRSELLFVGDSTRDGELAEGCGVPFVARAGTFSRATLSARFPDCPVVDHLSELDVHFAFGERRRESA